MAFKAPLLETVDDSLLMRPGGFWVYAKLHYLNEYLCRFIVSMRDKNWRAIHYIDLFAGPGRNCLDNRQIVHGSPILALSQPRPFDRYFFGDSDVASMNALKLRCNKFDEKVEKIEYLLGDANTMVEEVCRYIQELAIAFGEKEAFHCCVFWGDISGRT